MTRLILTWLAGVSLSAAAGDSVPTTNIVKWSTNGPAVFCTVQVPATNTVPGQNAVGRTQVVFDHYLPGSLNNLVWTNFIAHTNGRAVGIWSQRSHPSGWPTNAPLVKWATNGLMWGMKGLTALSPCWQGEGSSGQVPITALTRRHGYTRGHSMGSDGFRIMLAGKKVWFLTTNNTLVEMAVQREVVRVSGISGRDYSIFLFSEDLPPSIEPMRVVAATNLWARYPACEGAPRPIFGTEQSGHVSAGVPGFMVNTWKGGDSGSPDMLPLPGELVFFGGRSTSGPSGDMQRDMDTLCLMEKLDPRNYQMQWVDLERYPTYGRR